MLGCLMDVSRIKFAIITVSDSCSRGQNEDVGGPILKNLITSSKQFHGEVTFYTAIPDEIEQIRKQLLSLSHLSNDNADIIITTGGTGFSSRDVTPEATKCVIDKEANGLVTALLKRSLLATPMAALSRLTAGIKNRTLIVNFPGSTKAVQECWEVLEPLVNHTVHLLRENIVQVSQTHQTMQGGGHHHHHHNHHHNHESKVDVSRPANRARESEYPLISVEEATTIVMQKVAEFSRAVIDVKLIDSIGYVLADDICAPDPQPPFPASIKDGYAVLASDGKGIRKVGGVSIAGSETVPTVTSGYCLRVSTGAPVPNGADAVVQVEDTELIEEKNGEEVLIEIKLEPTVGQDIRPVGSDVAVSECVLCRNTSISSAEVGILASVGRVSVPVFRKPSVTVISTGNELSEPATVKLTYGKIRDSNRIQLISLLSQHGFKAIDGGIAVDDPSSLLGTITNALTKSDVLVTSGGVSMGEKDLLKKVLIDDLGFSIHFGRVFMKPGKPTTFATGYLEGQLKFVFGLPGNPVSSWVTAHLYVLPSLRQMSGFQNASLTEIKVQLLEDFKLDPRPEYCRATAVVLPDSNCLGASVTGVNQASSRLTSNKNANLLLKLPRKTNEKPKVDKFEIVTAVVIGAF